MGKLNFDKDILVRPEIIIMQYGACTTRVAVINNISLLAKKGMFKLIQIDSCSCDECWWE